MWWIACSSSCLSLKMSERCAWAQGSEDYQRYHDEEWGRTLAGDRELFERLCLEGFQAGLSWITVLRKREALRTALVDFDVEELADFTQDRISYAMSLPNVIKHRGKFTAVVGNARVLLEAWEREGEGWLSATFAAAAPTEASLRAQGFRRPPRVGSELPSQTLETQALAKDLKALGFRFVGPTTLYAAMQATGYVSDHLVGCPLRPISPI